MGESTEQVSMDEFRRLAEEVGKLNSAIDDLKKSQDGKLKEFFSKITGKDVEKEITSAIEKVASDIGKKYEKTLQVGQVKTAKLSGFSGMSKSDIVAIMIAAEIGRDGKPVDYEKAAKTYGSMADAILQLK